MEKKHGQLWHWRTFFSNGFYGNSGIGDILARFIVYLLRVFRSLVVNVKKVQVSIGNDVVHIGFSYYTSISCIGERYFSFGDMMAALAEHTGVNLVVMNAALFFDEDLVTLGIYYALRDALLHDVQASDQLPMNLLMHIFCTTQANDIQETCIPNDLLETARLQDVAFILVAVNGTTKSIDLAQQFIQDSCEFAMIEIDVKNPERNARIFDLVSSRFSNFASRSTAFSHNQTWNDISKFLISSMALFSLALQTKG